MGCPHGLLQDTLPQLVAVSVWRHSDKLRKQRMTVTPTHSRPWMHLPGYWFLRLFRAQTPLSLALRKGPRSAHTIIKLAVSVVYRFPSIYSSKCAIRGTKLKKKTIIWLQLRSNCSQNNRGEYTSAIVSPKYPSLYRGETPNVTTRTLSTRTSTGISVEAPHHAYQNGTDKRSVPPHPLYFGPRRAIFRTAISYTTYSVGAPADGIKLSEGNGKGVSYTTEWNTFIRT